MPNLADLNLAFSDALRLLTPHRLYAEDHPGCRQHRLFSPACSNHDKNVFTILADHIWSERLSDPSPFGQKFNCEKAAPVRIQRIGSASSLVSTVIFSLPSGGIPSS